MKGHLVIVEILDHNVHVTDVQHMAVYRNTTCCPIPVPRI